MFEPTYITIIDVHTVKYLIVFHHFLLSEFPTNLSRYYKHINRRFKFIVTERGHTKRCAQYKYTNINYKHEYMELGLCFLTINPPQSEKK